MDLTNRNALEEKERFHSDTFSNIPSTNSSPEQARYVINTRHSSLTDGTKHPNLARRPNSLTDGTQYPTLTNPKLVRRPQSLTDGSQTNIPTRRPQNLSLFAKRNSTSQLEMQSRYYGADSPVSRVFTSIATGLNRIHSTNSMTSLMSPISYDGYGGTNNFVIPVNTISPRPQTLTAQAELISHLEKKTVKGYQDVIVSEVRDGRILDSHIERPIAETISKINMWYSIPQGKTNLQ